MIAFIEGEVASKTASSAVIKAGGIGYELLMSGTSLSALPAVGEEAHVITYMSVTDAGVVLYGFMDAAEERLFRSLIAVSGIGPKMALATLSTYAPEELIAAVTAEDVKAISKVPGVGKKMASRMVLELKGALPSDPDQEDAASSAAVPSAMGNAIDALSSMGFTKAEIDAAMAGAPMDGDEESLLQYALKRIA